MYSLQMKFSKSNMLNFLPEKRQQNMWPIRGWTTTLCHNWNLKEVQELTVIIILALVAIVNNQMTLYNFLRKGIL